MGRYLAIGNEGYALGRRGDRVIVVSANTDVGALYSVFALLRHLQTHRPIASLGVSSAPAKIERRIFGSLGQP